jgi:glycosyltransferase involved in cell wall biosynthesis
VTSLGLVTNRPPAFAPLTEPGAVTPSIPSNTITVIIPAYRHEQFIAAAIGSALSQSSPPVQILVLDDASADGTVAAARAIADSRVSVSSNRQNIGLGPTVAAALASVKTPLVALLNSDDLFHPRRLERCRDALTLDPRVGIIATGLTLIDVDGHALTADNVSRLLDGRRIRAWVRWFERSRPEPIPAGPLFISLLRQNWLLSSSNIVGRTEYVRELIPDGVALNYCLDWHVFLSAAVDDRLAVLPEALLGYRLHGNNTVWFSGNTRPRYIEEVQRVAGMAIRRLLTRNLALGVPMVDGAAEALAANRAVKGARYLREELRPVLEGGAGTLAADAARTLLARMES